MTARLPAHSGRLLRTAPLAAGIVLAAVPLLAAEAPPVLLVVPPSSEVMKVEAARAAIPPSRALLTVGAAERVPLREGVELVLDRGFSDAPASDLVAVLPGEAAGEEEFLLARRKTAKVILFLGDSPLVKRLKGDGSRGALILVGGPEALRTLAGAEPGAAPPAAASLSEKPRPLETPTPLPAAIRQATPVPAEGAVRRYFSVRPTPTPTSAPRPESPR
ncbi:MAG TPA: hypothetical protein VJ776_04195 [Thermoanaerobaculia bacterium]|nr:hypothetical protein [Thermoanaerobaculia bacterium]